MDRECKALKIRCLISVKLLLMHEFLCPAETLNSKVSSPSLLDKASNPHPIGISMLLKELPFRFVGKAEHSIITKNAKKLQRFPMGL